MSESNLTKLKRVKGYEFRAEFDVAGMPSLIVDETKPAGENNGPNPPRLLSVAVGHCLSSSLLFCLNKARIDVKDFKTTIKTTPIRNDEGLLRIESMEVTVHVDVDEKDKTRASKCLEIFENYCTVTQSVRKGIDVITHTRLVSSPVTEHQP